MDDTQDYTNLFYIYEFAKIVLYQETSIALSVEELCERIEELSSLQYTEEDVKQAIVQINDGQIEVKDGSYALTSLGQERCRQKEKSNSLSFYVEKFLSSSEEEYTYNKSEIVDLVEKFVFLRYNENIQQIADIFDHCVEIGSSNENFTDEEKDIINKFLNWNEEDKNKCVYTLISKAYDYCMINSKCASADLNLSKFHFYIDTNILFRLLGLNGTLRQKAIETLIRKCKDSGVHLAVSNFVKQECETTINNQIDLLIDTTSRLTALVSPSSMSFAEENSLHIDFYKKYFHWVQGKNKHKNYKGFKSYILKELSYLLKQFETDDDNASYKVLSEEAFARYYNSLYDVKEDKKTTETDVNSFMLLLDKRKSFPEDEYFMISADRRLISWLKSTFPASQSIAEHPSTWLSIMLKYSGRELKTDYESFCQFIHLPITPQVEEVDKKIRIKSEIMTADFDARIKDMMIEDIRVNYSHYREYDTPEIIRKAYSKTENEIAAETARRKDEEHRKYVLAMGEKHSHELAELREIVVDIQSKKSDDVKDAYLRGKKDQELLDKETFLKERIRDRIKRNTKIRTTFSIVAFFAVGALILIWTCLYRNGNLQNGTELEQFFSSAFFSVLLTLINAALVVFPFSFFKKSIFPIEEEIVKTKIERMQKKQNKN